MLTKIQLQAFQYELPQKFDNDINILDLFTDGSAIYPTNGTLRIATWGVVVWTGQEFWPLSSGGVQGYHQTSLRGEIWAAISALGFVSKTGQKARLWTDNQTVFRFLVENLQGKAHNLDRRKDADLWGCLTDQLWNCRHFINDIVKIKAHIKPEDQEHHVDTWAVEGNQRADIVAAQARQALPVELWEVWGKAETWESQAHPLTHKLHKAIIDIGLKAVTSQGSKQEPTPVGTHPTQTFEPDAKLEKLVQISDEEIPPHFATDEARPLLEWLSKQLEGDEPTIWVSWQQLLVAYQMDTGRTGPRNLGRRWRNTTYRIHTEYEYPKYATWFPRYLQNLAKAVHLEVEVKHQRPPSFILAFWTGCIKVRMSPKT